MLALRVMIAHMWTHLARTSVAGGAGVYAGCADALQGTVGGIARTRVWGDVVDAGSVLMVSADAMPGGRGRIVRL